MADSQPVSDSADRTTTYDSSYDSGSQRSSGGISASRHLSSVLLAILLVPAAYVLLDYATFRAFSRLGGSGDGSAMPTKIIVTIGLAALCFFLAAATGRISAMGPLIAALVWGAGPAVWVLLDYRSFVERLQDVPDPYDSFGLGLLTSSFGVFPAVTGLLLGAAFAGRWRGTR
jgi:hypothetical protein